MATLSYQKGKSHEIRIETLSKEKKDNNELLDKLDDKNWFFTDEYNEAIEMINSIIALNQENKQENKQDSINNRILFVGQRGTGKTSVMKSLSGLLESYQKFTCLPMVDPSNFDNNTNILLTVITMMFSEAKRLMQNRQSEENIGEREELLKGFDDVFKSLKAITSNDTPSYTLEGLNEKSRALLMRSGMEKLVEQYLNYNSDKNQKKEYLVLLIDDIDMTVSHAPEMLEQLRKYLNIKKVIILMSANLGQLYNEMREHYSKAFKETLKDNNQALSIDVEDLANKYLLKLFPTSRRIRVEHNISQLINTHLEIKNPVNYNDRLQKVILSLIWQKTRLLFIPKDSESMIHPIIPTNLRELMQFLDMLTSLEDVEYKNDNQDPRLFWDKDAYEACERNITRFKKYFLNNWVPNHLSVEEELVFENIPSDITEINKHLINSINIIGTKHKTDLMSREVGLDMIERNAEDVNIDRDIYTMVSLNDPKFVKANKISDIFNQPSNYSYGDLLLMIDKYETYFESEDNRKFTDAIKIYYSILLFETMFFKSNNVTYETTNKKDLDELLIPIQKLIGGTVYYPNYFEIITDKHFTQKGPSYDAKRAFYHKLPVNNDLGEKYPLFSILYYGDIRPDRYDTKHIYDTTFENDSDIDGTKYVTFDILSILSNMLNPLHTYNRAGVNNQDIIDNIIEWGRFCTINNNKKITIPNSILPFYSVDMMLQYLKHSLPSEKVVKKQILDEMKQILDEIIEFRGNFTKVLLGSINLDYQWNDIINTLMNNKKATNEERQKLKTICEKLKITSKKPLQVQEHEKRILVANVSILSNIYNCYKTHSVCPPKYGIKDIVNPFKDYAISVLLKDYQGGKKNLNSLIKEIHKCGTISETYRLLVDKLWVNFIDEVLIQSKIQSQIREKQSVRVYYELLWEKTEKYLAIITSNNSTKDSEQTATTNNTEESQKPKIEINIYKTIFGKAADIFIDMKENKSCANR